MPGSIISQSPAFLAEDIGPSITATASLMIVFSTVFVGLRFYARFLAHAKFGVEDVITPFAWLGEMGICITGIVMVEKAGTGRHQDYLLMTNPEKIPEHQKGVIVLEILHPPAVAFAKIAVLILYLKVFTNRAEKLATWITVFLVLGTWFSYTIAILFQCQPFSFNWDKTIPGGHWSVIPGEGFNVLALAQSSSVPNIVTDIIVLLLPIRTVLDLKISNARKVGLLIIFLIGSVGIIASIIRTIKFSSISFVDVTYRDTTAIIWNIIEPGMYLLAACALSFKPLFNMVAKALRLKSLVTHTRSYVFKENNTKTGITARSQDVHLKTMKTSSSDGFAKLDSGRDTIDEEENIEFKYQADITITEIRGRETPVEEDDLVLPIQLQNSELQSNKSEYQDDARDTIGRAT